MYEQKVFPIASVQHGLVQEFLKLVGDGKKPHWNPESNVAGEIVSPNVVSIGNDNFGRGEIKLMCKIDDKGNPIQVLYSLFTRENGAIDDETGFGTPSVFFVPVKPDENGDMMFGFTDEKRPVIRARYQLREDGTYLDFQDSVVNYEEQPGDVITHLPEPVEGEEWRDRSGEVINRHFYRTGVDVKGFSGGYGTKKVSDATSVKIETKEEQGIEEEPTIVLFSSMDRAWAPVMDIYGLTLVPSDDVIGETNRGEHEMLSEGIEWIYPDEMDIRLTPDNHMIVSLMAACWKLGLIGRTPVSRPWNEEIENIIENY